MRRSARFAFPVGRCRLRALLRLSAEETTMISGRPFYTILVHHSCYFILRFARGDLCARLAQASRQIVAAHGMHRTTLSARMDSRCGKPSQSQID
jgi:hypothetical protein